MSKTTLVNTKTLRGAQTAADGSAHYLISRGRDEAKSHPKDTKQRQAQVAQQGCALDGSSTKERKDRLVSIRNSNTTENNRSKSRTDKGGPEKQNMPPAPNEPSESLPIPNTEKMPLLEYYKRGGVDYRLLRKNCRIRVNGEGSGAKGETGVFVDFYKLPDGYTVDDLPDSQGALSQNNEHPLSPAVMIAANYKKKERTQVLSLTPDNTDTCDEIIRRIQMGRRCKKNEPVENYESTEMNLQQLTDCNDTFPDTSLNDSALMMASQEVEDQMEVGTDYEKLACKDACKRDINGNKKQTPPPCVPLTSTPLPDLVKNVMPVKETPKTARAVCRSRNRSIGQATSNAAVFEKSMFDNSGVTENIMDMSVDGEGDATPRKILKFDEDESPIKNVIFEHVLEIRCDTKEDKLIDGEFDDDNEDELFSQVEMPGEIRIPKPSVSESSLESANSAHVDEGSNGQADANCGEMEDSYLNPDALDALAKLEAIHCSSIGSAGSSANNNSDGKVKTVSSKCASNFTQKKETPRTRARRMGLSRKVVVR